MLPLNIVYIGGPSRNEVFGPNFESKPPPMNLADRFAAIASLSERNNFVYVNINYRFTRRSPHIAGQALAKRILDCFNR